MESFSKQDARFEPPMLDLSNYSVNDMIKDLGIHRRVELPLSGCIRKEAPPPPDINKRGPTLARVAERDADITTAWGSLYDPDLEESRDDGIGAGQMHRTGTNFIPDVVHHKDGPRIRRVRSFEEGGRFELGKKPGKLPYPRGAPDPSGVHRKPIVRRRDRSPDEHAGSILNELSIMDELRAMSALRVRKNAILKRPTKGVGSHNIAPGGSMRVGVTPRAAVRMPPTVTARSTSMPPGLPAHISSVIRPANPLVSPWGSGILATTKAGYDYAEHVGSKLSGISTNFQERSVNKVNAFAPQARDINKINPAVPHERALNKSIIDASQTPANAAQRALAAEVKIVPPSTSTNLPPSLATTEAVSKVAVPRPIPFPDPSQFFPTPPVQNTNWAGDNPFIPFAGEKLADVTNNIDNTAKAENSNTETAKLVVRQESTHSNPVVEQARPGSPKIDPAIKHEPLDNVETIPHPDKAFPNASQLREAPEPTHAENTTDFIKSNCSSEFGETGSTRNNHNPDDSYQEPNNLLLDVREITEGLKELKAKYLDYDGFEKNLGERVRQIQGLKDSLLRDIEEEEERLKRLASGISVLRARRAASSENLRSIIPNNEEVMENDSIPAQVMVMMHRNAALLDEHELRDEGEEVTIIYDTVGEGGEGGEGEIEEPAIKKEVSESGQTGLGNNLAGHDELEDNLDRSLFNRTEFLNTSSKKSKEEVVEKREVIVKKEEESENEKITLQKIRNEEKIKKEELENDHPATESLKQGQNAETSFTTHTAKVEFEKEYEAGHVGALLEQELIIKEVEDRELNDQAEKKRLVTARIGGHMMPAEKKDPGDTHINKIHFETQNLERERLNEARVEAGRLRRKELKQKEAQEARAEEMRLVKDHLEKVCRQEQLVKFNRAERARVESENRHLAKREEPRLKSEKLGQANRGLAQQPPEKVQGENLERDFEGMGLGVQPLRDRRSALERPTTTPSRTSFNMLSIHATGYSIPTTGSDSPAPCVGNVYDIQKSLFPYVLELDLSPIWGPEKLHVTVQKHERPDAPILRRCVEILTAAEYRILIELGDFKKFIDVADARHTRRLAAAGQQGQLK